jgi:hypothetical protein
MAEQKPLNAAMDNVLAWKLGKVANEAMDPKQSVGDYIDRGLILLRLLNEAGFDVIQQPSPTDGKAQEP